MQKDSFTYLGEETVEIDQDDDWKEDTKKLDKRSFEAGSSENHRQLAVSNKFKLCSNPGNNNRKRNLPNVFTAKKRYPEDNKRPAYTQLFVPKLDL